MRAIKAIELRDRFKDICDLVVGGETFIVSRPYSQNVVVLSEAEYNEMAKAKRNTEYLAMIDRSIQELAEGKVVVKTMDELEAITDG
jgi:antitoxin YefM